MNHTDGHSTLIKRFCDWMGREHHFSGLLDWVARQVVGEFRPPLVWSGAFSGPPLSRAKASDDYDLIHAPMHSEGGLPEFIIRGVQHALDSVGDVATRVSERMHQAAKDAEKNACKNPKYSGMHGSPCLFAGGSDTKCPKGTVGGWFWAKSTAVGTIYYADCCGGSVSSSVWCDNSSEPNWCLGAGRAARQGIVKYACTVALFKSEFKVDSNGFIEGIDP